jgi:uncharacterized SAM-binding protein YcdF (DUF218 family)
VKDDLQCIINFLSLRTISALSKEQLLLQEGVARVDAVVLLGNSILSSLDVAASAIKNGLTDKILVAGGVGHSTSYLYDNIDKSPSFACADYRGKTEAKIFSEILAIKFGLDPLHILAETKSTNCGANALEAYRLMLQQNLNWKSIILIQDPTMQLRSHLSFTKCWPDTRIISFAPFIPTVINHPSGFAFGNSNIAGLWQPKRFLDLVLGEIPRLRNDSQGYGSTGKNFISDVEIPEHVENAYARMLKWFPEYDTINIRS